MNTALENELQNIRVACWTYGVFDVAKHLQENRRKLDMLINHLVEIGMKKHAYIIAKENLSQVEFKTYNHLFADSKAIAESTKNKLKQEAFNDLTGGDLKEHKKRLRKKRIAEEKKASKQLRLAKNPKNNGASSEIVYVNINSKSFLDIEASSSRKSASQFAPFTPDEFGYSADKIKIVNNRSTFLSAKEKILKKERIGFDTQFDGVVISVVSISTDEEIYLIDFQLLSKVKDVIKFLRELLIESDIEVITHTFKLDAYVLHHAHSIDPYKMKNIIDLSARLLDKNGDKIGLKGMAEYYLERTLRRNYQKINWMKRPFSERQILIASIEASLPLLILLKHNETVGELEYEGYDYIPPDVPPRGFQGKRKREKKECSQTDGNQLSDVSSLKSFVTETQKDASPTDPNNKPAKKRNTISGGLTPESAPKRITNVRGKGGRAGKGKSKFF